MHSVRLTGSRREPRDSLGAATQAATEREPARAAQNHQEPRPKLYMLA
jgi:hypothetical protein